MVTNCLCSHTCIAILQLLTTFALPLRIIQCGFNLPVQLSIGVFSFSWKLLSKEAIMAFTPKFLNRYILIFNFNKQNVASACFNHTIIQNMIMLSFIKTMVIHEVLNVCRTVYLYKMENIGFKNVNINWSYSISVGNAIYYSIKRCLDVCL